MPAHSPLLSPREQEVVNYVAEGYSNRQIAKRLKLSEHTIRNYIFRIFDKLGLSSRVELLLYVFSQRDTNWSEQRIKEKIMPKMKTLPEPVLFHLDDGKGIVKCSSCDEIISTEEPVESTADLLKASFAELFQRHVDARHKDDEVK